MEPIRIHHRSIFWKATSYEEGNYTLIERLAVIKEGDENSESATSAVVYLRQWQELYSKYMRYQVI